MSDSNTDSKLIYATLEVIAERDLDMTDKLHSLMSERSESVAKVFHGVPLNRRNAMLTHVIEMVLSHVEREPTRDLFQIVEIPWHDRMGISSSMYRVYFDAMLDTMGDLLGGVWTDSHRGAWERQFEVLNKKVEGNSTLIDCVSA
jgi:hemoglobin-like flavoprotein